MVKKKHKCQECGYFGEMYVNTKTDKICNDCYANLVCCPEKYMVG